MPGVEIPEGKGDLPGEYEGEAEAADEYFEERQKEVATVAAQYGLSIPCEVRHGHAAKALVTFAKEGAYDLIVVGHSDHSEPSCGAGCSATRPTGSATTLIAAC